MLIHNVIATPTSITNFPLVSIVIGNALLAVFSEQVVRQTISKSLKSVQKIIQSIFASIFA
jgi:hypothetical protein